MAWISFKWMNHIPQVIQYVCNFQTSYNQRHQDGKKHKCKARHQSSKGGQPLPAAHWSPAHHPASMRGCPARG
jgi:hypothetical protein